MAYDGAGTFNRPVSDYVFDTVISETDMNTEMDGIATGLSNVVCKDGQTTPTANLPMGGFKHTNVAVASARTDYARTSQVQDSAFIWCGTAGGTKNALTLTPSPAITAYATGQEFIFKAGATASDDAVTIAISGLTTKAGQINDTALSATLFIEANKYYKALYDGTALQLTRLSGLPFTPPSSSTDNAAARFDSTTGRIIQNSALVIADTTGALSRSGNGGIPVQGTNTNDSASAGDIGEYASSTVASGSAVSLTNETAANVTSISLTAGDWDVSGIVSFSGPDTTNVNYIIGSISTTSATLDTTPDRRFDAGWGTGGTNPQGGGVLPSTHPGPTRISISSTTTVYLVAQAKFQTNTLSAFGTIRARRVR